MRSKDLDFDFCKGVGEWECFSLFLIFGEKWGVDFLGVFVKSVVAIYKKPSVMVKRSAINKFQKWGLDLFWKERPLTRPWKAPRSWKCLGREKVLSWLKSPSRPSFRRVPWLSKNTTDILKKVSPLSVKSCVGILKIDTSTSKSPP